MTDAKNALVVRRENGGVATNNLADDIRRMEDQFALAMPKGREAAQLVRDALTAVRTTRNLDKCDSASVMGALMTCAQLGLRPGVLGHAWVLPFWNAKRDKLPDGKFRGGHSAQLILGYQGIIELAHRSPAVASIVARAVHERDEFDVDYGIRDDLVHKPYRGPEGRGDITDYYAIVKFTGGGYAFWTMTKAEVERHRDKYATAKYEGRVIGPWKTDFDAMALKTCIRMLAKYMPKSGDLAQALEADESIRVDLSPDVEPAEAAEHIDAEIVGDES
jgi:recombination protein RecT